MTSFACFLAWLLQLPPVIGLVITSGRLLDAALAILIDPETGAVRDLDTWALDAIERALQTAETSISRAIWLRARQLAGLPRPPHAPPFRYLAPRHLSNGAAMARRGAHLVQRLYRLERHASALARSMSWTAAPEVRTCAWMDPACTVHALAVSPEFHCIRFAEAHAPVARGPQRKTGPPPEGVLFVTP